MKAQKPAQGISIDSDFGNARVFNVECDCTADDHAIKMWIEVNQDPDIPDVELTFYVNTWTPFFESWRERLRAIWDIAINGVHKQQHSMLLNQQSALNLAEAIRTTVRDMGTK